VERRLQYAALSCFVQAQIELEFHMPKNFLVFASVVGLIAPAFASDFESECISGSPDGVTDAESQAYCSCLADVTEGDERTRSEIVTSWPVEDIDVWLAGLSADAAAAAASCAP